MMGFKRTKYFLAEIFLILVVYYNFDISTFFSTTKIEPSEAVQKNFVILSSSLKPRYLFLLPITVASWQNVNTSAIVFLIGSQRDFEKDRQAMATINLLKEMNAEIIFLESKKLSPVSLSQIIRLFPAALPISNKFDPEKTIFITSDADLFVFHLENHVPNLKLNKTLQLYNSRCCDPVSVPPKRGKNKVRMYPMGTVAATITTWRNIMEFDNSDFTAAKIEDYVIEEFGPNFFHFNDTNNPSLIGSAIWYADQSLFSYKLDLWLKKPSSNQLVSEHIQAPRRIDRIKWPRLEKFKDMQIENWDDCHQPTAAFEEKEWFKFKPFLEFAFQDNLNLMEKLQKYRDEFVGIKQKCK